MNIFQFRNGLQLNDYCIFNQQLQSKPITMNLPTPIEYWQRYLGLNSQCHKFQLNRYSHELLARSGYFALHIISGEQKNLLPRFKGSIPNHKFKSIAWEYGVTECPILADCIGCMECRVTQRLAPGNHTVFIGEVVNAVFNAEGTPLCTLDYEGRYLGKA